MRLFKFGSVEPDNFTQHLIEQAAIGVSGLEHLVAFMKEGKRQHADAVNRAEKEADEVRRLLVDELNRTFVTPYDREDIFSLSRAIDDIIDYAHSTVEEMSVLGVSPDRHLADMAQILLEGSIEIHHAMQRLHTEPHAAREHSHKAKAAENSMERAYHAAIAELFAAPPDPAHIITALKKREIYRHLSNAADRADEAANVIGDIVVKTT